MINRLEGYRQLVQLDSEAGATESAVATVRATLQAKLAAGQPMPSTTDVATGLVLLGFNKPGSRVRATMLLREITGDEPPDTTRTGCAP